WETWRKRRADLTIMARYLKLNEIDSMALLGERPDIYIVNEISWLNDLGGRTRKSNLIELKTHISVVLGQFSKMPNISESPLIKQFKRQEIQMKAMALLISFFAVRMTELYVLLKLFKVGFSLERRQTFNKNHYFGTSRNRPFLPLITVVRHQQPSFINLRFNLLIMDRQYAMQQRQRQELVVLPFWRLMLSHAIFLPQQWSMHSIIDLCRGTQDLYQSKA
ncbi:MAG: hypothetical protein EZS28_051994, partial [Streblomastix strix]